MRTPYCTALKLASRSVDELRSRIGEAQEEVASLQGRAAVLRAVVASERSARAGEIRLPETGWFCRTAADQRAIAERRASLEQALERLRDEARVELASLRALEQAADNARSERTRANARREQAVADDRAALLFRDRNRPGSEERAR